jgi:hypothetical protein
MISGPGYYSVIEREADGWYVHDSGPSWTIVLGPYRWKWQARFARWCIDAS